MSKLEKLLRKCFPKTVSLIEKKSIDMYFWEATRPDNKINVIHVYQGEFATYHIKITREK